MDFLGTLLPLRKGVNCNLIAFAKGGWGDLHVHKYSGLSFCGKPQAHTSCRKGGASMESRKYVRSVVTVYTLLSIWLSAAQVRAELKPGEVLNQSNWQEA